MAALTGRKPGTPDNTYQMLLCVDHAGGIDNTARPVQDGAGNVSCLSLATIGATVAGTFSVSSTCAAAAFSGSGAGLTALTADNISAGTLALARGGTGAALADPNADRILFWDDSAGSFTFLTVGSGLNLTDTTLTAGAGGLSDGDYGDVVISGTATVFTIDSGVVTYAKMQNVSAASRLLGRGSSAGAGVVQEIALGTALSMSGTTLNCTATGSGAGGDITVGGYSARPAAATAGKLYLANDLAGVMWYDTGSQWDLILPVYAAYTERVILGDWTAASLGTSTVTDANGLVLFKCQAGSGSDQLRYYKKAIDAAPYTRTVGIRLCVPTNTYSQAFFGVREASSGKSTLWTLSNAGGSDEIAVRVENFTNDTTYASDVGTAQVVAGLAALVVYLRIADDNVNRTYSWSTDNVNFQTFTTQARTANGTPDFFVFGMNTTQSTYTPVASFYFFR